MAACRLFPIIGGLVLLLGIVRGTVFGPIKSLDALFGTAYGITWLVALVATLVLFYTGARHISPAFERLRDTADFSSEFARFQRITRFDLGLFFVIFTCMILMRFGL